MPSFDFLLPLPVKKHSLLHRYFDFRIKQIPNVHFMTEEKYIKTVPKLVGIKPVTRIPLPLSGNFYPRQRLL